MRPSPRENEYFARKEAEQIRQAANERQQRLLAEERHTERALHFMRCPKCGMRLEEITVGAVSADKCSGCAGIWLDKGELDLIREEEAGFLGRLLNTFR